MHLSRRDNPLQTGRLTTRDLDRILVETRPIYPELRIVKVEGGTDWDALSSGWLPNSARVAVKPWMGPTTPKPPGPIAGAAIPFHLSRHRVYFGIRQIAYRAENLRKGVDFGIALERLWRAVDADDIPDKLRHVVLGEIAAMTDGDIPRFSAEAGSCDLDGGVATPIAGQFEGTELDCAGRHLDDAGGRTWQRNQEIVRAVLHALPREEGPTDPGHRRTGPVLTNGEALAEAEAIGAHVCARMASRRRGLLDRSRFPHATQQLPVRSP